MRNSKTYLVVGTIICLLFTVFFMFPLVIMVVRSFSNGGPSNYVKVFDKYNLFLNFSTSVIVVGLSLVIVAMVVSLASFAFAKLEFPCKKLLYYTLLGGMMVPTAATIYPLYQIVKLLNLISSPFSLILPYATASCCFNLMILKNYYDAIPNEMIEAASIDGATPLQQFRYITLPLLSPTSLFLFITTFISSMKVYQSVDVMTGGGPRQQTEVMVYYIYRLAFDDNRIDRASVVALLFFVVLLIVTASTMRITNKNVHYEA